MSILSVIQQASILSGAKDTKPPSAVASSDSLIVQMLEIAQVEGDETVKHATWRNCKIPCTITGDSVTQVFSLPLDFESFPISPFLYSDSFPLIPLPGPLTSEEWIALQAFPASTIRPVYRLMGGAIEIWPALAQGEVVKGEYVSSYWIMQKDGITRTPTFNFDTDLCLIPEEIIKLGVIWRWKKAKGLEYQDDKDMWKRTRDRIAGNESGNRTVRMSSNFNSGISNYWPGIIQVP